MSIQNDVEKLYRSDLEKQRQKQKKKKKKRLLGVLLTVIIIAALILIMQYLGLGLGGGKGEGSGEGKDVSTSSNDTSVTTTTTAVPKEFYKIRVSGSTYIIENSITDISAIRSTLKLMKENVIVCIIDDNATKNAMDDLKKALDEENMEYTETTLDESTTDSSSVDNTVSETVR